MTWSSLLGARVGSRAPAVIADEEMWTGDQLMRRAAGAADWLDDVSAPAERPVACLLSTSASAFALIIAGASTRRPMAPLGPKLTVEELAACVTRLDSPVLVAEPEFADVAEAVAARTSRRLELLPVISASARSLDLDPPSDAAAAILHTSGTTGLPKAVRYQPGSARSASGGQRLARATRPRLRLRLVVSAASHRWPRDAVRGARGGRNTADVRRVQHRELARPRAPWRDARPAGADDDRHPARARRSPPAALRTLQYGAAPIHPDTLGAAMEALPGRAVHQHLRADRRKPDHVPHGRGPRARRHRATRAAAVGRAGPRPGSRCASKAPDPDGVGEVVARAAHLFEPDADGWLRTGDLGPARRRTATSTCPGARGDKIIRGGENIYPVEVEDVLVSHPDVREVAVVGVARPAMGRGREGRRRATAIPASRPGQRSSTFARGHLAGFKVPVEWEYADALPRNQAGKVLRRVLVPAGAQKR